MPLEQELIDMMLDVLVLESVVKDSAGVPIKDKFGKLTWTEPLPVRCQYARMNKISQTRDGVEVTSTFQAILADPTIVINDSDRVTLSDGSHPAIIQVLALKDDQGPYYLEIRA
jgi:hypothetical protein